MSPPPQRFVCSPGGVVAAGRRRLRGLLLGLALLMAGVALATGLVGHLVPALLAAGVALLALTARSMSGDLDPFWLELGGDRLSIQMRRQRALLPLVGATARRLRREEIAHLERLATAGGVTAGVGGFDSSQLGELDLYVTDFGHAILIRYASPESGEGGQVIVSPDDPELFLEALESTRSAGNAGG